MAARKRTLERCLTFGGPGSSSEIEAITVAPQPGLKELSEKEHLGEICCALGPPACAAPCSCHHEACSARHCAQEVYRSFLSIPPPWLLRRPLVLLVTLSPATTACPPS